VLSGGPQRPGGLPPTGGGAVPGDGESWLITFGSLAAGVLIVFVLRQTIFRGDD
jgi:hypothetical protein